MPLTGVKLENFTVFEKLEMDFSPGINVLIGPNGSGKTHLMKVLYSAIRAARDNVRFSNKFHEKMFRCLLPDDGNISRLMRRESNAQETIISVTGKTANSNQDHSVHMNIYPDKMPIYNHSDEGNTFLWEQMDDTKSIFIPAKEILSNTYKLNASVDVNHLAFDDTYLDVINAAKIIALTEPMPEQKALLHRIEEITGGTVYYDERRDEFYLVRGDNQMEFSLVAEGIRKLALLWQLIHNRHLVKGSILFWDEPEANITPSNIPLIVDTLLELQRGGVQIFLATHDYFLPNYLEARRKETDKILYHSLYLSDHGAKAESGEHYRDLSHNPILDTVVSVYEEEVDRAWND